MLLIKETQDKFGFDPTKLSHGSNKSCLCKCDYCGIIVEKKYYKYISSRKIIEKDACENYECRFKKREETNLLTKGVIHHSQTQEYKDKFKKTCLKRFGVENPFASDAVKEKSKNTIKERYGVENVAHLDSVKEQKRQTNIERIGVPYPYQNPEILAQVHKNIKQKYGVEHFAQTEKFKKESSERNKFSFIEITNMCDKKSYIPLFAEEEYRDTRQILKFKCKIHDFEFSTQLHYITKTREDNQCPKCKIIGTSRPEQEIYNFVKSYFSDALSGDRKTINPFELDIHIPSKNIAIEYHGLYWHSEKFKERKFHLNKFNECKDKNIQLIQLFEDEWRDKRHICENIIKAKLGLISNRTHARKLIVLESTKENKILFEEFFNKNHLQSNTRFEKAFGLIDDQNDLKIAISLRKPFIKRGNRIEIARLVTKNDTIVSGGFQRIFKAVKIWAKNQQYEQILTYSDCRYSWGESYRKAGFIFESHEGPDYFYTDFINRFGRFKFRAQSNKPEKQVAQENNVVKIYGAGNYRWTMNL